MSKNDDHIEIKFPKGKLKAKHVAIVTVFVIFMYFLQDILKQVLATKFENPSISILIVALILTVIGSVTVYIVSQLSSANHDK